MSDPFISIWTPAEALARIDALDAKVSTLDQSIKSMPGSGELLASWSAWREAWNKFAADMRDSWFQRGFSNTRNLILEYEAQFYQYVHLFEAEGGNFYGPGPTPEEDGSVLPWIALGAVGVLATGALGYFGYRYFKTYKKIAFGEFKSPKKNKRRSTKRLKG